MENNLPQLGDQLCDMHDRFRFLDPCWRVLDQWRVEHAGGSAFIEGVWKSYGLDHYYVNKLLVVLAPPRQGEPLRCAYSYDDRYLGFVSLEKQN